MWSRARLRLLSAASAAPDTGILVASADRKGGCCKPTAAEMTACGHDLVRSIADEQTWSRRADLEQTSRLALLPLVCLQIGCLQIGHPAFTTVLLDCDSRVNLSEREFSNVFRKHTSLFRANFSHDCICP
jgi:hypothetical protein